MQKGGLPSISPRGQHLTTVEKNAILEEGTTASFVCQHWRKEREMTNVPNYDDYISVTEAAATYGTTKSFFYDAINAGDIRGFDLPGKRGTHMLRAELAQFMQPKEKKPKADTG
jgi:hypothetical protein